MTDILYKHGDLMKATETYLLHGCNAQGVMGSGVAKLVRDKYPHAFEVYAAAHAQRPLRLGQSVWAKGSPHTVINLVSQEFYGRDPEVVYVDYEQGIRQGFRQINLSFEPGKAWDGYSVSGHAPEGTDVTDPMLIANPEYSIAMPLIGAGLANGDWAIISKIIEEEATNFQPVVYLVDGNIPGGIIPASGHFQTAPRG